MAPHFWFSIGKMLETVHEPGSLSQAQDSVKMSRAWGIGVLGKSMLPVCALPLDFGTQLPIANGLAGPESKIHSNLELYSASSLSPRQRRSYESLIVVMGAEGTRNPTHDSLSFSLSFLITFRGLRVSAQIPGRQLRTGNSELHKVILRL